jgi:hypothetical protein
MRSWILPATLLACLASRGAAADALGTAAPRPCSEVPALARSFTDVATLRAAFTDRKDIALLDAPLISKGHVYYQRPDRLHLATESPARQSVTLAGTRVKIVQADLGREASMDLGASEIARAVVSNLLLVLGGRIDALTALYRCEATQDGDSWRLSLVPLRAPLSGVVRGMAIRLALDGTLREVRIEETDGDSSTMTFQDTVANRPFTDEEARAYFTP